MNGEREGSVTAAFVSIADSLVDDYDVVDMLEQLTGDCARLIAVESVGMLLADAEGVLQVAAASSKRMRLMELYQVQCREGPCLDCYRDGVPVLVADLDQERARWPDFVTVAREVGYASVHAVPIRLRENVLGALGLFGTAPGALSDEDLALARALAHVGAIALVTNKATADAAEVNAQLQTALDSRVLIEQAKGLLSEQAGIDMDTAFVLLRRYAREHNTRLQDLAQALVARELPARQVLDYARTRATPGSLRE